MLTKRKQYMEDKEVLEYMSKNVPKQEESLWIRAATRDKMFKEKLSKRDKKSK